VARSIVAFIKNPLPPDWHGRVITRLFAPASGFAPKYRGQREPPIGIAATEAGALLATGQAVDPVVSTLLFLLQKHDVRRITRTMRWGAGLPFLLLLAAPAGAEPQSLGVFGQWAAFEKDGPRTCYAIAAPFQSLKPRGWKPFASVGYWPQARLRGQVHFRLSREKREGSAVLLRIADRTFQLLAGKTDAWAPDAAADALIIQAMRSGVDMVVETRARSGILVRDVYQLRGAATAIDAAAIACAR
jgi:hypothetical protein